MKKLILITGILLSTSLWASPMDKICYTKTSPIAEEEKLDYDFVKHLKFIMNNCERNNILNVVGIGSTYVDYYEAQFCRFDRNVNKTLVSGTEGDGIYDMNCVLYSNIPRTSISPSKD